MAIPEFTGFFSDYPLYALETEIDSGINTAIPPVFEIEFSQQSGVFQTFNIPGTIGGGFPSASAFITGGTEIDYSDILNLNPSVIGDYVVLSSTTSASNPVNFYTGLQSIPNFGPFLGQPADVQFTVDPSGPAYVTSQGVNDLAFVNGFSLAWNTSYTGTTANGIFFDVFLGNGSFTPSGFVTQVAGTIINAAGTATISSAVFGRTFSTSLPAAFGSLTTSILYDNILEEILGNIGTNDDVGGLVYNTQDSMSGDQFINLIWADTSGANTVDLDTDLSGALNGVGTIRSNLWAGPVGLGADFDTYIKTGDGADIILGTQGRDFIRAGGSQDVIDAQGGNDVVRFGTGADDVYLGSGNDVVYITADQLDGSTNTINDFVSAADQIFIDERIEDLDITFNAGNLVISYDGVDTTIDANISLDASEVEFV